MDYAEYMQSPEWQKRAQQRKEKDGNKCVWCGSRKNLQVHHITYANFGHEDIEKDLVTLCKDCHEEVHKQKNWVLDGIMQAFAILKLDETEEGISGFLRARGIKSKKSVRRTQEWIKENMAAVYVPCPSGGAITIPFFLNPCRKDAERILKYLKIEYLPNEKEWRKAYTNGFFDDAIISEIGKE